MPPSQNSRKNLPEHSEAKIELLGRYLRNYLSVITNDDYTDRIRIFDLFCGQGIYENEGEGSPIVILREIKNLYFTRLSKKARTPRIDCYFSDENNENVKKVIDAVSGLHLHYPAIGSLSCIPAKYQSKVQELIAESPRPRSEKSFVFIDPYGYKDVKGMEIKALLEKRAEVLLFLPIQFMYRFETHGTPDALKEFLSELKDFDEWSPSRNAGRFIEQLREASFRKVPGQENLISDLETLYLEDDLFSYFQSGPKNNCEVYEFVLSKEFLPKHARKVCQKFIADGRLKVVGISNSPTKSGAFYVNYDHYKDGNKKVQFEVI